MKTKLCITGLALLAAITTQIHALPPCDCVTNYIQLAIVSTSSGGPWCPIEGTPKILGYITYSNYTCVCDTFVLPNYTKAISGVPVSSTNNPALTNWPGTSTGSTWKLPMHNWNITTNCIPDIINPTILYRSMHAFGLQSKTNLAQEWSDYITVTNLVSPVSMLSLWYKNGVICGTNLSVVSGGQTHDAYGFGTGSTDPQRFFRMVVY